MRSFPRGLPLASAILLLGGVFAVVGLGPSALAGPGEPSGTISLSVPEIDRRTSEVLNQEKSLLEEREKLLEADRELSSRIRSNGRAYYRLTRAGLLPVAGGFDELVRHAMRLERVRRNLVADLGREKQARERAVLIARTLESLAKEKAKLVTQRASAESARVAALDENRRGEAFSRAFERGASSHDSMEVYGGKGADLGGTRAPSVEDGPGGFSASKGRLLFPVVGRAELRSVRREGANGPGLEILAPAGSTVRAVHSGRVAFADRYGPFGRIVILDHGQHYYTVSGNLGSIDSQIGAEVSAGEKIGTVGDEGAGAMLYFEVRKGSQTVAPEPWLGMRGAQ